MKLKIKEVSQENLIAQIQKNLKSSEKYFLISTKEMLDQIKMNLETFCPKIESNRIIDCYIEKVPKIFEHPIIYISLEKKNIDLKELEEFIEIHKESLPLIPINNTLDFDNRGELGWFLRKIFGYHHPIQDHIVQGITRDIANSGEIAIGLVDYEPKIMTRGVVVNFIKFSFELASTGQLDKAIEAMKIAKVLDSNFFVIYQLAMVYFQISDLKKCKEHLKESLELNPKFSQSIKVLGMCYFLENEFEKALEQFEKIDTKKFPKREIFDVELHLGRTKIMMGLYDQALNHFNQAEELVEDNDFKKFHKMIASWQLHSLLLKHDYQKMVEILEVMTKNEPENQFYWNNLGFCYDNLGKKQDALNSFLKSFELNHNNPVALMNLGLIYQTENKFTDALEKFKKLKENQEKIPKNMISVIDEMIEYNQKMINDGKGILQVEREDELMLFLKQRLSKNINSELEKFDSSLEKMHKISSTELRKKFNELKRTINEFIRKKYNSNIKSFQNDDQLFANRLNQTHRKISDLGEKDNDSGIVKKETKDLFDYIDFGDFPFIMKRKKSWNIPMDIMNSLYNAKDYRNTIAHFGGPEEGELDIIDSNAAYSDSIRLIRYFEKRIIA